MPPWPRVINSEVLAVDQDSLGLQGVKVASYGDGLEVWSKALSISGERAVLLLNRTGDAASISAHWTDLGLEDASPATVRDIWTHKDLGSFNSNYTATVQSNDAVMVDYSGQGKQGDSIFSRRRRRRQGPGSQL